MDVHQGHEPYLSAVVAAVHAAGLLVRKWHADADDLRSGAIVLSSGCTRAAHGEAEVVLLWNESGGWFGGVSRPEDEQELWLLRSADLGVLPGPDVVATWACEVAADRDSATPSTGWIDRSVGARPVDFEQQLCAYWPDDEVLPQRR